MGVSAIISDFGGVLTSPLSDLFASLREDPSVDLEAFGAALWAASEKRGSNLFFDLEKGFVSEADFLAAVGAELGRELPSLADRFGSALEPNHELFAWFRGVHERGVRLAILTNNVREWERHWRPLLPIDEIFDVVVDSAFVGLRKPEPEIYALTLERLGIPDPGEVAFVDDIEVNVVAARAFGLHGVVFESTPQAIADLEALLA